MANGLGFGFCLGILIFSLGILSFSLGIGFSLNLGLNRQLWWWVVLGCSVMGGLGFGFEFGLGNWLLFGFWV